MSIDSKVKLAPGETLKEESFRSKGFIGETDIATYSVVDSAGNIVGTVEHTQHTTVRGLRVTNTLVQWDSQGNILVDTRW